MLECPDCHAVLKPKATRCACGWQQKATTTAAGALPADSMHFNCADESRGQRCANPGVYTASTQGSDRWYCFDHFPPFRSWNAVKRSAPGAGFRAISDKMRHVGELFDAETLAEREALQAEH